MSYQSEYEVKCPQTWAWYTGYVQNYDIEKKKMLITYRDDWKQSEWVDVDSVRERFDMSSRDNWRPKEEEEVECKARAEENEPYGWWPCTSKKFIQSSSNKSSEEQLFSVAFNGWGDAHNELLSLSFIRPKSQSKVLSARNMYREVYNVPDKLQDWVNQHCQNGTLLDTLMPQKKISSQIVHIDYLRDKNKLLLIGNKRVLITMKDIIYCHFKRQETIARLEKRTKDLEKKSREKKEQELKAEKYTFNIHPLLSGYLRGRKGGNLDSVARKYHPKLLKIEPGLQTCCVLAKDKLTLKKAVDELEIVCKKVLIPLEEMGQIIGAKGQQIQDIKQKSQVIKIISWEKWSDEFWQLKEGQRNYYINVGWENDKEENRSDNPEDWVKYVPPIIENTDERNIFDKGDIVDLSVGYESQYVHTQSTTQTSTNELAEDDPNAPDALVIIGRKSRVDLCIFMIEMTLNHFRTITKTKKNVFLLRTKINEIKGNPPPQAYTPRNRGRRDRGRDRRYGNQGQGQGQGQGGNQGSYDETKENSPKQQGYDDGGYQKGGGNQGGGGYRSRGGKQGRGGRGRGYNKSYDKPYDKSYDNRGGGGKYQPRGGRRGYNQGGGGGRQSSGARQYKPKYQGGGGGGHNGQYEQYEQYDDYQGDGGYDDQWNNNQENNNNQQQGTGQGGDGGNKSQNNKGGKKKNRTRGRAKKNRNDGGNKQQQQNQNEAQTEQPSTS